MEEVVHFNRRAVTCALCSAAALSLAGRGWPQGASPVDGQEAADPYAGLADMPDDGLPDVEDDYVCLVKEDIPATGLNITPYGANGQSLLQDAQPLADELEITPFGTATAALRWRPRDGLTPGGKVTLACGFFSGASDPQKIRVMNAANQWTQGNVGDLLDHLDRLIAAFRFDDRIAKIDQLLAHDAAHGRIIFNQQDQLATQRQGGFFAGHVFICPGGNRGQYHQHRGSLAGLALNRDAATRLLGEAMSHGEAEPAAQAEAFGREEGLAGAGQRCGIHAAAVVGDFDQHVAARHDIETCGFTVQFDRPRGDMKLAAVRHRIA